MTSPQAVITREREVSPPPGPEKPKRRRRMPGLASDDRLAKRAGRGDPEAFEAIFRRYERDLYRFCVGILGEPQDAQDAIQNTMLKVMRALPGERREIQLKPWLYRIAHNEAIELRRRQRPVEPLEPGLADVGLSVDESAERSERLRVLFRDMTDLPQRQRAALVMRELNGLEFGEIGAALGTSPSAVRQALYEARRGLQQMELGRQMDCDAVTYALSDEDGRLRGRRDIRAHLRNCRDCRRFRREIGERKQTLAAISPLPLLVVGTFVKSALAGSGAGGAGAAGVGGGIAAGTAAGTGLAKTVAGVLAVVAIGTAAVDRSGLVDPQEQPRDGAIERDASVDRARSGVTTSGRPDRVEARGAEVSGVASARASSPPSAPATSADREVGPAAGAASPATRSAGPELTPPSPRQSTDPVRVPDGSPQPAGIGVGSPSQSDHPEHPVHPEHPAHPEPRTGQGEVAEIEAGSEAEGRSEQAPGQQAKAEGEPTQPETMAEEKQAKAEAKAEESQAQSELKAAEKQAKSEAKAEKKEAHEGKPEKATPKAEPKPEKTEAKPAKPAKEPKPARVPPPAEPVPTEPAATAAAPTATEPVSDESSGKGDAYGAAKQEAPAESPAEPE